MTKVANLRIPVLFALLMCSGILAGIILSFLYQSSLWLLLAVPAVALIPLICLLFKVKSIKLYILCALALAIILVGGFTSFARLKNFENTNVGLDELCEVSGRVTEKGYAGEGEYVICDRLNIDGEKAGGKMYVYLSQRYGEFCDVGYTINFTSLVRPQTAFEYAELNYFAEQDIRYYAPVYSNLKSQYGFSLFGTLRAKIRNLLYENTDSESAGICFALLTGNTDGIQNSTMLNFRYGGVAHLFAVSGLHIGILFSIVRFITKKLRFNKYLGAAVCLVIVFLYAGVCGFTVSSVRAAIMCTVAQIARLLNKKYDGLNSLAISVIIILAVNPLHLFSVGFQLSVCAVGSILILSPVISRFLRKIKTPAKLGSIVSVSLSAQLGTLPVMLSSFGYLSGAGLLMNIVIVPLISALYAVLFAAVIICLIIPPAAALVSVAALPIEAVTSFLVVYGFEKSLISFGSTAFAPLYFAALLFASDKLNLGIIKRLIAVALTVILLVGCTLLKFNSPYSGYTVTVHSHYEGFEVVVKSQNGAYVVFDDKEESDIDGLLSDCGISHADAIIILTDKPESYFSKFDCDNIYLFSRTENTRIADGATYNYGRRFSLAGTEVIFVDGESVILNIGDVDLGICAGGNKLIRSSDIFITPRENAYCISDFELCTDDPNAPFNGFYCGNFTIQIEDGVYAVSSARPPKP